jgi:hypothetical protein
MIKERLTNPKHVTIKKVRTLLEACNLLDSSHKSDSLIVASPNVVAKICSLHGLKNNELTWQSNEVHYA